MGRGLQEKSSAEMILYGRTAIRGAPVDFTASRLNMRSQQELERLCQQINNGQTKEALKIFNQLRAQPNLAASKRLAEAFSVYMIDDRYYSEEVSPEALSRFKQAALSALRERAEKKRISNKDLRELFFEGSAIISNDPQDQVMLHHLNFESQLRIRTRASMESNKEDLWLEQGLLPLLQEAVVQERSMADVDIALSCLNTLVNQAVTGKSKAMSSWSKGNRWINGQAYRRAFFKSLQPSRFDHTENMSLTVDQFFQQSKDVMFKKVAERMTQGAVSTSELAVLGQRSIAEVCIAEARQKITAQNPFMLFPLNLLSEQEKKIWRQARENYKATGEYPHEAVDAALEAYHLPRGSQGVSVPYPRPKIRMAEAFVANL